MKTEQIAEELNQIQITHAKAFSRLADMFTLNGETGVLIWLNQQQRDVFAIDIIDHFGLTAGRVANIVKKLEQKGYLTREHNITDLRKSLIRLTKSGMDYADEQYAQMHGNHIRIVESLGEEEAVTMLRLLNRILFQLERTA